MGSQERRHREGSRGLGQGRKGLGKVSRLETEAEEGEGRAMESSCRAHPVFKEGWRKVCETQEPERSCQAPSYAESQPPVTCGM